MYVLVMRGIGVCAVALAAAIAGGGHVHQPGIEPVLEIANQFSVFDQHCSFGGRTLVIGREGAAPVGNRAVVNNGNAWRCDLFAP